MIELERGPRKNPDYEAKGDWMYYPKGHYDSTPEFKANFPTWNQEAFTNMADGEKVIYKFHICPALGDYLTRTRKIITNFLHKNHIMPAALFGRTRRDMGRKAIRRQCQRTERGTQ
jgi:hypothetical protein